MNSVRRRRARPRRVSVNFRTFFWVLQREAVLRIVYPASMQTHTERAARAAVANGSTFQALAVARRMLAANPARQTWAPREEYHPFATPLAFDFWTMSASASSCVPSPSSSPDAASTPGAP